MAHISPFRSSGEDIQLCDPGTRGAGQQLRRTGVCLPSPLLIGLSSLHLEHGDWQGLDCPGRQHAQGVQRWRLLHCEGEQFVQCDCAQLQYHNTAANAKNETLADDDFADE